MIIFIFLLLLQHYICLYRIITVRHYGCMIELLRFIFLYDIITEHLYFIFLYDSITIMMLILDFLQTNRGSRHSARCLVITSTNYVFIKKGEEEERNRTQPQGKGHGKGGWSKDVWSSPPDTCSRGPVLLDQQEGNSPAIHWSLSARAEI